MAVLALYDFASKQEFIYRTSKIKEISGASALMSGMYQKFVDILADKGLRLQYDISTAFSTERFESNQEINGEVLYDGGGNLMILWKSKNDYVAANKVISVYLLVNAPGLTIVSCSVDYNGDFEEDKKALYEKNAERKNRFPAYDSSTVTPVTQIDAETFLPVTYKRNKNDVRGCVYPAKEVSLSSDRVAKANAYTKSESKLDEDKGMLAVIYIDGNSMGQKLQACKSEKYEDGIEKLRSFSKQVNDYYVIKLVDAIKKEKFDFRQIIGGGDEITLICKAEDALKIMQVYFDTLGKSEIILAGNQFRCTSCAGIAVFHAKSPFNVAYDIAEAACEQAKEKAHENDGNYFSFYYCHSGIVNIFDILHEKEQEQASGKPYSVEDLSVMEDLKAVLNAAGRANVKALGAAAQISKERYSLEVERVNAYLKNDGPKFKGTDEMNMVYDMSEFYDLWFSKTGGEAK